MRSRIAVAAFLAVLPTALHHDRIDPIIDEIWRWRMGMLPLGELAARAGGEGIPRHGGAGPWLYLAVSHLLFRLGADLAAAKLLSSAVFFAALARFALHLDRAWGVRASWAGLALLGLSPLAQVASCDAEEYIWTILLAVEAVPIVLGPDPPSLARLAVLSFLSAGFHPLAAVGTAGCAVAAALRGAPILRTGAALLPALVWFLPMRSGGAPRGASGEVFDVADSTLRWAKELFFLYYGPRGTGGAGLGLLAIASVFGLREIPRDRRAAAAAPVLVALAAWSAAGLLGARFLYPRYFAFALPLGLLWPAAAARAKGGAACVALLAAFLALSTPRLFTRDVYREGIRACLAWSDARGAGLRIHPEIESALVARHLDSRGRDAFFAEDAELARATALRVRGIPEREPSIEAGLGDPLPAHVAVIRFNRESGEPRAAALAAALAARGYVREEVVTPAFRKEAALWARPDSATRVLP